LHSALIDGMVGREGVVIEQGIVNGTLWKHLPRHAALGEAVASDISDAVHGFMTQKEPVCRGHLDATLHSILASDSFERSRSAVL
jgi:hypothetical protein